jgi:hypothetical protein
VTTERKTVALTDADLARMQLQALESIKDPEARIRAIADIRGGESVAIQREQLAIMSASRRAAENVDSVVAEKQRQAGEKHSAIAQGRCAWSALVDFPLTLEEVRESPTVVVRVKLAGHRYGAGETRVISTHPKTGVETREPCEGQHSITTASVVDAAEASRLIRASVYEPHLAALEERERYGDQVGLMEMKKALDGRGTAGMPGYLHIFWGAVTRPMINKLVCRKPLEVLVAAKVCTLVGEIELDETPIRTEIDQP